jgi:hypothetical protein
MPLTDTTLAGARAHAITYYVEPARHVAMTCDATTYKT